MQPVRSRPDKDRRPETEETGTQVRCPCSLVGPRAGRARESRPETGPCPACFRPCSIPRRRRGRHLRLLPEKLPEADVRGVDEGHVGKRHGAAAARALPGFPPANSPACFSRSSISRRVARNPSVPKKASSHGRNLARHLLPNLLQPPPDQPLAVPVPLPLHGRVEEKDEVRLFFRMGNGAPRAAKGAPSAVRLRAYPHRP